MPYNSIPDFDKSITPSRRWPRTTHGMADTPLHRDWLQLINCCTLPSVKAFANYGGRGISVCNEWRHDFQAFYDHVTKLPHFGEQGYSLDRIDNDGNYEPGNMRWATRKEQSRNRRSVRWFTVDGETKCLSDWAHDSGIPLTTLHRWLKQGASLEDILASKR